VRADPTQDRPVARLLEQLRTREPQAAWSQFLESYSALILQVVQLLERDDDQVAECFLYVCQALTRNRFRRLRRFNLRGPASFPTWLRAVVRNLCLDWYRREHGRPRSFQVIVRLSALDRAVFRCTYEQGLSLEQTYHSLRQGFPELVMAQVEESLERIQSSLTRRHHWLLSLRRRAVEPLSGDSPSNGQPSRAEIASPHPGPEALAALHEQQAALSRVLARLPAPDRLLIRLRFEQELTLEQVARLTGLGSAQKADYRIKGILERLRNEMV
jgi:RNA polymerase sigma factor (sigma-70 family)